MAGFYNARRLSLILVLRERLELPTYRLQGGCTTSCANGAN